MRSFLQVGKQSEQNAWRVGLGSDAPQVHPCDGILHYIDVCCEAISKIRAFLQSASYFL